jgi:hypothetical protein
MYILAELGCLRLPTADRARPAARDRSSEQQPASSRRGPVKKGGRARPAGYQPLSRSQLVRSQVAAGRRANQASSRKKGRSDKRLATAAGSERACTRGAAFILVPRSLCLLSAAMATEHSCTRERGGRPGPWGLVRTCSVSLSLPPTVLPALAMH